MLTTFHLNSGAALPQQLDRRSLRRRKALADAIAGVVATLVSLWTFYPIDVWKTKLQAGTDPNKKKSLWLLQKNLFRGLPLKTIHSASSSFTYFYLYSAILSWWTTRKSNNNNKNMSTAMRLTLSAIAAVVNTFLTLPLDVLASQHQASEETEQGEEETQEESSASDMGDEAAKEHDLTSNVSQQQQQQQKMDRIWRQLATPNNQQTPALVDENGDVFYDPSPEKCDEMNDENDNEQQFAKHNKIREKTKTKEEDPYTYTYSHQPRRVMLTLSSFYQDHYFRMDSTATNNNSEQHKRVSKDARSSLAQITSLWKGLVPSLLLCSNPSINYTVFDVIKNYLLRSSSSNSHDDSRNLTMVEAFFLGLFAKFCATMATYPLIRAKVMLMVTSRTSMWHTLIESYQKGGIQKGWYKGCSIQLLHTVLKSALLMMVKERIAVTTHRLLVPPHKNAAEPKAG